MTRNEPRLDGEATPGGRRLHYSPELQSSVYWFVQRTRAGAESRLNIEIEKEYVSCYALEKTEISIFFPLE